MGRIGLRLTLRFLNGNSDNVERRMARQSFRIPKLNGFMTPFRMSDALRRAHESRTGIRSGFPTNDELARLPYIVTLDGLTPAVLGYRRFRLVLSRCVLAAVQIAPLEFRHTATHAGVERVGYEFLFSTRLAATRFRLVYDAAMQGQSCPTPLVQP